MINGRSKQLVHNVPFSIIDTRLIRQQIENREQFLLYFIKDRFLMVVILINKNLMSSQKIQYSLSILKLVKFLNNGEIKRKYF